MEELAGELLVNMGDFLWGDENVLELDTAEGIQLCKYTKCHWIFML